MNLVIRFIIVALATVFPKFKFAYGGFLIVGMTFVTALFFFGAYLDHGSGQPDWVVRNMIFLGIGASVIGWVLGIALMRQAERHEAMNKSSLEDCEHKQEKNEREKKSKVI
ncbi:MAG: hypothetical protein P8I79_01825 [Amylibacter sp.]|nr:hypothetical protein [Amylibacter sp.]|tara:strand:+ start:947 stop:1279 length:333 start_codon:yes stop_codon:yes gene_type:complete